MPPKQQQKRKDGSSKSSVPDRNPRAQKRVKLFDLRQIRTEPTHSALNEHQELDVGAFVKTHQNEIKALEHSMGLAKKGLATRAFQSVPRELRRRTASHNVKRVPKRLQNRAKKEMKEDDTPTVTRRAREKSGKQRLRSQVAEEKRKEKKEDKEGRADTAAGGEMSEKPPDDQRLALPPVTNPKFKKRQIHKSWLPTHVWHAKRAQMTEPQVPLWRFAIPLKPTEKAYRTTHRASTLRGCIAWDTSYMSCISVSGDQRSLLGLLRSIGTPEDYLSGKQGEKWRKGRRSWSGWLRERDNEQALIARVVVVWDCTIDDVKRQRLLVRVHPSAFLQLWDEICKVAKMQRPVVKVEDLRFEIGSIEIAGPAATETLVGILSLADADEATKEQWSMLAGVNSTGSLPANTLLNYSVLDPRLGQPHRTAKLPDDEEKLLQTLTQWPFDSASSVKSLLDGKTRSEGSHLLSQKSINRRKGDEISGNHPSVQSTDCAIPTLFLASNTIGTLSPSGSWTLLLPWKCILPVWYSLMHYPVSSGGNPRLGGLEQQRQLCFENSTPWFPGDFPGTKAGWEWELLEREKRKHDWEKRPKGKRVEWSSLDLGTTQKGEVGDGWSCDWEKLLEISSQESSDKQAVMEGVIKPANNSIPPSALHQYNGIPRVPSKKGISSTALATVSISLLNRGHAAACARIYRLPSNNVQLRRSWQELASPVAKSGLKKTKATSVGLEGKPSAADESYPHVPETVDLVGFVTSGNYNLGEGKATGIGNLLLARLFDETSNNEGPSQDTNGLCIIREAGQKVGRLAKWQLI